MNGSSLWGHHIITIIPTPASQTNTSTYYLDKSGKNKLSSPNPSPKFKALADLNIFFNVDIIANEKSSQLVSTKSPPAKHALSLWPQMEAKTQ